MKTFEFKSQICTTKEQSERLLALGLKKETADMWLRWLYRYKNEDYYLPISSEIETHKDIPAWSLHRLLEMLYADTGECIMFFPNAYDEVIADIEGCIRKGIFNKDYLEEKQ